MCADTLLNPPRRLPVQPTERNTAPTSYAAALLASTALPNNGGVVGSGACGVEAKTVGLRPVGLQGETAAEDGAAAAEEDERTEAEILGEMSLEILRRRLSGQIGRLRRKEKKLQRQSEEVAAEEALVGEQKVSLNKLQNEVSATKEEITSSNSVVHTFSRRISELSGAQDEQPAPLSLAMAPPAFARPDSPRLRWRTSVGTAYRGGNGYR